MMQENHEPEQAAIGEVLKCQGQAFASCSAEGLEGIYTEDAKLTNTSGATLKGSDQILSYLENLFADGGVVAWRSRREPRASISLLSGEVAVVKTYVEREGQGSAEDGVPPRRHKHSMKFMEKQNGQWRIASETYLDARDQQTLVND